MKPSLLSHLASVRFVVAHCMPLEIARVKGGFHLKIQNGAFVDAKGEPINGEPQPTTFQHACSLAEALIAYLEKPFTDGEIRAWAAAVEKDKSVSAEDRRAIAALVERLFSAPPADSAVLMKSLRISAQALVPSRLRRRIIVDALP